MSHITRRRWTMSELNCLREMMADGCTHREVGDALGRSEAAVDFMCGKYRIPSRALGRRPMKINPVKRKEIAAAAARKPVSVVARIFRCSPNTVYKIINEEREEVRRQKKNA